MKEQVKWLVNTHIRHLYFLGKLVFAKLKAFVKIQQAG